MTELATYQLLWGWWVIGLLDREVLPHRTAVLLAALSGAPAEGELEEEPVDAVEQVAEEQPKGESDEPGCDVDLGSALAELAARKAELGPQPRIGFPPPAGQPDEASEMELDELAPDLGEEPEIAGLYIISEDGTPCRVGFALGNEVSDHVMEKQNYLYLAHSKIRPCCFGPELLLGELPRDMRGMSRVLRDGEVLWEQEFLTGEDNMSHTIANLEYHQFKYEMFRRPGDVHCHFFGTATLSFASGIKPTVGDVFDITAPPFHCALRNPLEADRTPYRAVRQL